MDRRAIFVANLARWMRDEREVTDAVWLRVIAAEYGATDGEAGRLLSEAAILRPAISTT